MRILHSLLSDEINPIPVMPALCSHVCLTDGETWETLPPLCSLVQAFSVLPALLLHSWVTTTANMFSSDQGILLLCKFAFYLLPFHTRAWSFHKHYVSVIHSVDIYNGCLLCGFYSKESVQTNVLMHVSALAQKYTIVKLNSRELPSYKFLHMWGWV